MNRRSGLLFLLLVTIILSSWSEKAVAQFGGSGAFGSFESFIRNLTVSIGLQNQEQIRNTTNGVVCLKGIGETNEEDFCIDLEVASNTMTTFSNTGFNFAEWSNSWTFSGNMTTFIYPPSYGADPCTTARPSAIFWNNVNNEMCYCANTGADFASVDLRLDDGSTACFP